MNDRWFDDDPRHGDEQLRDLLRRAEGPLTPSRAERAEMSHTMLSAYASEHARTHRIGSSAGRLLVGGTELLDLTAEPPSVDRRKNVRQRWLPALAAALLLVVAGALVVFEPGRDVSVDTAPLSAPSRNHRFDLGGSPIELTHAGELRMIRQTAEFVEFEVLVDDRPSGSTIVVASVESLFDERSPADFFAAERIVANSPGFVLDEPVGWSATVANDAAAEFGCGLGDACVSFAELADGSELFVDAGNLVSIDLYEGSEGQRIVVITGNGNGEFSNPTPLRPPILEALLIDP